MLCSLPSSAVPKSLLNIVRVLPFGKSTIKRTIDDTGDVHIEGRGIWLTRVAA